MPETVSEPPTSFFLFWPYLSNMKKVVKLTESDLIKMVKNIVNEQGMFGGPSNMETLVKRLFPNIKVIGNSVLLNDKLLFYSDSEQCVEAFLYGMIVAKSQNNKS